MNSETLSNFLNLTIESMPFNASNFITSKYDYVVTEIYINTSTDHIENFTLPNFGNVTTTEKATLNLYNYIIPTISALVIAFNLAVVISSGLILKRGQQPRSTYLFLGNVAMSDLVTGIAIIIGLEYPNKYRNNIICAIQMGMIVSSTLASVYSVGLIAVDRFLFILHGLQYQKWVYPFRARMAILASWIIGLVIGFLPLMGWAGDTKNGQICWFILLAPKQLIRLTVTIGAIPLITVLILYSIILYHAIKKIIILQKAAKADVENKIEIADNGLRIFKGRGIVSDSVNDELPEGSDKEKKEKSIFKRIFMKKPNNDIKSPSKWKAIKVVMFTSGSFLFTWGPYFIASFIYTFCEEGSQTFKTLTVLIASPFAILGFLNSFINPIIYAWWHQGFRTFVIKKVDSIRRKRISTANDSSKTTSSSDIRRSSKTNSTNNSVLNLNPIGQEASKSASNSRRSSKNCEENIVSVQLEVELKGAG